MKVTKYKNRAVEYKCECGAKGFFGIRKEFPEDGALVVSVKCPECEASDLITLLQYSSEENKELLLKELEGVTFTYEPEGG